MQGGLEIIQERHYELVPAHPHIRAGASLGCPLDFDENHPILSGLEAH